MSIIRQQLVTGRVALLVLAAVLLMPAACGQSEETVPVPATAEKPNVRQSYSGPLPAMAAARLGRSSVTTLQVSPDGQSLAVGGQVGLLLYDALNLDDIWQLSTPSPVTSVAFSRQGEILAAGMADGSLNLFDATNGAIVGAMQSEEDGSRAISALAWSESQGSIAGQRLAIGFSDGTGLLAVAAGNEDQEFTVNVTAVLERQESGISAMALDPSSAILAIGNRSGLVNLHDASSGGRVAQLAGHEANHAVHSLTWSPDGQQLASSASDGALILWNTAEALPVQTFSRDGHEALTVAFTGDDSGLISIWQDGSMLLWDSQEQDGQPQRIHSGAKQAAAAWSPLRQAWYGVSPEGRLQLGYLANSQYAHEPTYRVLGHSDPVASAAAVSWSPDSQLLASSLGEKVILWNVAQETPKMILEGHEAPVTALAWSPDGQSLASGSRDQRVVIWDTGSGELWQKLTGHESVVTDLAWSPDGRFLVSAGSLDNTAIVWEVAAGEERHRLRNTNGLWSLAWSPDSQTLATGTTEGQVILWQVSETDAERGETLRRHFDWVSALAWSPDGRFLASASADQHLVLTDLELRKSRSYVGHQAPIKAVAFSSDGTQLASAGHDNVLMLWDATPDGPNEPQEILLGHSGTINDLSWSPEDAQVATAAEDGTVIIWDVSQASE